MFSSVRRAFAMSLNRFEVHGVNELQLAETWISEQELMHAHEGGGDAQHLVHEESEFACAGMSASIGCMLRSINHA